MSRWEITGTATLAGRTVNVARTHAGDVYARTNKGWRVVADFEITNVVWA